MKRAARPITTTEPGDIKINWSVPPYGKPIFCNAVCYHKGKQVFEKKGIVSSGIKDHLLTRIFRGTKSVPVDRIDLEVLIQWTRGETIHVKKISKK